MKRNVAPADGIWQDRDVLFDLDTRMLRLTPGEHTIERIEHVEDTKGNNGDQGILRITNLRLVWHAVSMPRINLSIGYNTINGITTRIAKSKIRGTAESLYIMAKGLSHTKFEFIFTCINPSYTKLFATVIGMHRAYETSKIYREMKMRTALVDGDERLRLLPLETQINSFDGVWNLTGDQGSLGVLVITNVRIAWFSSMNTNFNVSIPFLQIRSCRIRESKFGQALVIETSVQSGEFILGFQIKPLPRLEAVCKEIQALQSAYQSSPILGVQYTKGEVAQANEDANIPPVAENEPIEAQEKPLRIDAFAAYFSNGTLPNSEAEQRPIVYSDELGIAIEQLKSGFTIRDLWEIHFD